MIELEPGDEVIAVTSFRDYVLIFTKRGEIYALDYNPSVGYILGKLP